MIFELTYHGTEEITILWDYNNITRGTARLFGFLPKELTTVNQKLYSDRTPDVSTTLLTLQYLKFQVLVVRETHLEEISLKGFN